MHMDGRRTSARLELFFILEDSFRTQVSLHDTMICSPAARTDSVQIQSLERSMALFLSYVTVSLNSDGVETTISTEVKCTIFR
jgi:hypothetical protein